MSHRELQEKDFSLKNYFVPFTTTKAIHFIVIIGLIVFCNGLFNNFAGDDLQQISDNVSVHSITNFVSFFTGSTYYNGGAQSFAGAYYKPLLTTFYAIIYSVFGANYFAYHLFQLLLHSANACLVFLLFKKFFKRSLAFLLSLIFLIHPINSEAVYYIADLQDVLFFFFGIIALHFTIIKQSKKTIFLVPLLLFLSLLSKETGIAFMAVTILYAFFFNKKQLYLLSISSVLVFLPYLFLRIDAVGFLTKTASAPIDRLTLMERLINIPAMVLFYIQTFLFPLGLSFSYQWVYTTITFDHFFLPLLIDCVLLLGIILLGVLLYKRSSKLFKMYVFFTLWFLLGIALHLQIFPLDATVAERWFYFPIVGLLGMLGVVFEVTHSNLKNKWIFVVAALLIILLSTRTFLRSFDWRNELALASHDMTVSKDDNFLENIISLELLRQGKIKEAKVYAEKSINSFPFYTNINTLGVIYANMGDYKKARETYLEALKYGNFYLTYENLGGLTLVSGTPKENVALLKSLLQKYPANAKLWLFLAMVDYEHKDMREAKAAVQNAYYYNPSADNYYFYTKIINGQPFDIKVDPRLK